MYFSGHGEHKSKAFIYLSQVKLKVYCKLINFSSQHLLFMVLIAKCELKIATVS